MRDDQPDKTDHPGKSHRRGSGQRGGDQYKQLGALHRQTQLPSFFFPELQHVEHVPGEGPATPSPAACRAAAASTGCPAGHGGSAQQEGDGAVQLALGADHQEGGQRRGERSHRHPGQDQRGQRYHVSNVRQPVNHENGQRSTNEGRQRDERQSRTNWTGNAASWPARLPAPPRKPPRSGTGQPAGCGTGPGRPPRCWPALPRSGPPAGCAAGASATGWWHNTAANPRRIGDPRQAGC